MELSLLSSLNPNAPIFVPMAYRAVEDFSDQWWDLVRSCSGFRDYWLQECFHDPETESLLSEIDDHVLGLDAVFDAHLKRPEEEMRKGRELISSGALKRSNHRSDIVTQRYSPKPPKIVNQKVSPRTIHQPR
ncbi:hypothetical protein Nepgr_021181 [Nepenthes gracilis]|uniref:Early response to dehydration 15-like protein n=1 Tax=Nepenthes gracilis TaxID=150966 RepID=A0AAD3SWS9_NEPGR|nr:hypothetical protein Nepgr_021181 [Nepenthes gracilis]